MPDWLARLREEVTGEPAPEGTAPAAGRGGDLEWLGAMPAVEGEEEGPPPGDVPEWIEGGPAEAGEEGGAVPEWLARIRERARGEGVMEDVAPPEAEPAPAAETPSMEFGPLPPQPSTDQAPGSLGLPDWLLAAKPADEAPAPSPPAEAEAPAWLRGVTDDGSQELPRVPALVFDGEGALPEPAPEIDLSSLSAQLPEWMGESRPAEPAERPDLAPATLPAWLEAMRPVDTFRSVIEFESSEDQVVESAGPLAGLRGVLMAEPVVAMPRAAAGEVTRLEVNERQYAQAELLHRLIEDERREARIRPAVRPRPSVLRWVVGAAMLLAVGLPAVTGLPGFALPAFAPQDLVRLAGDGVNPGLIDNVAPDRPVLLVFDYDAGATGEMESVAGPLLAHLMQRGIPIATLSTRPGGSVLAERLLAQEAAAYNYVRGQDFIHLGYLPGGPAAIQLFAASPRQAVSAGFLTEGLPSVWDSPILAGVAGLSDFGLLAVVTSGSEEAREWIEQGDPYLGDSPLVVVVSAGAEPLVRPYYESTDPKVQGILSGLTSAVAYEQRLGKVGLAHARWGSYGGGLLAAEVFVALGAVAGIAGAVIRPRRR